MTAGIPPERLRESALYHPSDISARIPGRAAARLDVARAVREALEAGVPGDAVWYASSRMVANEVEISLTPPVALLLIEQLREIAGESEGKDLELLVAAAKAVKALFDALGPVIKRG